MVLGRSTWCNPITSMTDVVVRRTMVRRLDAAIVSFNVFAIAMDIDMSDTIGW